MPIIRRSPQPTATFAQRLQLRMSAKRVSQSELARLVGYTPTAIWNWLQGNTLPRAETLAALANILEVTEDWLRDGDPVKAAEDVSEEKALEPKTMAEMIEHLRANIANLTGYEIERVKLTLEFSSG
ncbi:helix-turn-helix domain-containing protein [Mesorhizobium delmotii]|uniref:HTH cro/C1-type domain-containing protein n=1 Tax=Mesorhizobium delmotii TaxID=1631247 RepID=A0A2P9ATA6_9HYPH|nr:helix-turn-helix domain-containing protein [Mesorhizobium delmotii]SJM34355.1 hypothetical protein BQ8482_420005 [Mesorhizobium delmotii]